MVILGQLMIHPPTLINSHDQLKYPFQDGQYLNINMDLKPN
jgi:hypothetical protein